MRSAICSRYRRLESRTLLCRQVHFPQDWCWPRVLETTHLLRPNREQYFFVTCDQGSNTAIRGRTVARSILDGDARIESCRRVDLTNWDRLPVSTVFYDGESSPGSPRSVANNSVMRWPNWPAIRPLGDDWRVMQRYAQIRCFVGPQPIARRARDQSSISWLATQPMAIGKSRSAMAANFNRRR